MRTKVVTELATDAATAYRHQIKVGERHSASNRGSSAISDRREERQARVHRALIHRSVMSGEHENWKMMCVKALIRPAISKLTSWPAGVGWRTAASRGSREPALLPPLTEHAAAAAGNRYPRTDDRRRRRATGAVRAAPSDNSRLSRRLNLFRRAVWKQRVTGRKHRQRHSEKKHSSEGPLCKDKLGNACEKISGFFANRVSSWHFRSQLPPGHSVKCIILAKNGVLEAFDPLPRLKSVF